jgi:hypothetical protein
MCVGGGRAAKYGGNPRWEALFRVVLLFSCVYIIKLLAKTRFVRLYVSDGDQDC